MVKISAIFVLIGLGILVGAPSQLQNIHAFWWVDQQVKQLNEITEYQEV